jgi:hypothetical protein
MLGGVQTASAKTPAGHALFSQLSSIELRSMQKLSTCLGWKRNRPTEQKVRCGPVIENACGALEQETRQFDALVGQYKTRRR